MMKRKLILLLLLTPILAQRLESYNIDRNGISVSGLSAGAAFATQLHVAHSAVIMGCAMFAGMPYWCAQGSLVLAMNTCMMFPDNIDVTELVDFTNRKATEGAIDSVSNLANSRVFLFHGTQDGTVEPGASTKTQEYYQRFSASIATELTMGAGHGMPTIDSGVACPESDTPYINRCNYNGAYHALNYIYNGNITNPNGRTQIASNLLGYDQGEFQDSNIESFDTNGGWVYVPNGCKDRSKPCRLHIALHGCLQGREEIQDQFARLTEYCDVAETNDVIVLFPQIVGSMSNPNGCFDWWAYDEEMMEEEAYVLKSGRQISTIKGMIDRLTGDRP